MATLAALLASYWIYVRTVSLPLAAMPIALVIVAWAGRAKYLKSAHYRSAEQLYRSIELELPSIVLALTSIGEAAQQSDAAAVTRSG